MNARVPFLWLCGPSGVGKTTVGWEIYDQLGRAGSATAFVDADQLGLCYPSTADDPYNHRLKARNLGAVWQAFRAAGAESVVMSGGIEVAEQIGVYADWVPEAALTLCRLRVGHATLTERFVTRGWMPDLVAEAVAEADELDRLDFADLCIDTDGLSVEAAAKLVRERAGGWPTPLAVTGRAAAGSGAAGSGAAGSGAAGSGAAGSGAAGSGAAGSAAGAVRVGSGLAAGAIGAGSGSTADVAGLGLGATAGAGATALDQGAVPVLMLCGATAVGKSTVGYEVFTRIRSEVKAAYVDLAQIGFCHPTLSDDPGNHRLKAANLAAMWPAFRDAGARCLVVTGRVNDAAAIRVYAEALAGMAVTVCRLHAGQDALTERVLRRGHGKGPNIAGEELRGKPVAVLHEVAARAAREAAELHRDGVGDFWVDTDGCSVAEVAGLVRERFGR